jgi:hypothetical protein
MSTRTIKFNHPGDGDWVMARSHGIYNDKLDQVIAVHRNNKIAGGVVYSMFLRTSISMTSAGSEDNWPTRDFLWIMFDYPFNVLGVTWCLTMVDATNVRSLDINERLGFHEITRVPRILEGDKDLIIMGMERHESWALNHITPRHWCAKNRSSPRLTTVGSDGYD